MYILSLNIIQIQNVICINEKIIFVWFIIIDYFDSLAAHFILTKKNRRTFEIIKRTYTKNKIDFI